jgi:hypothetical protein
MHYMSLGMVMVGHSTCPEVGIIKFVNNTRPGKKHEVLATQSITDQSVKAKALKLTKYEKEKRPDRAFNPEWKIAQPWLHYMSLGMVMVGHSTCPEVGITCDENMLMY